MGTRIKWKQWPRRHYTCKPRNTSEETKPVNTLIFVSASRTENFCQFLSFKPPRLCYFTGKVWQEAEYFCPVGLCYHHRATGSGPSAVFQVLINWSFYSFLSWQSLALWLAAACISVFASVVTHGALLWFPVLSQCFLLIRTPIILDLGPTPNNLILTWLYLQRLTVFQIRSHSHTPKLSISMYLFGVHNSTNNTTQSGKGLDFQSQKHHLPSCFLSKCFMPWIAFFLPPLQ